MGLVFNPFTNTFDFTGSGGSGGSVAWKAPVADESTLPGSGNTVGDARVAIDTGNIFTWSGSAWVNQSSGEAPLTSVSLSDSVTDQPLVILNKVSESSVFLEYSILRNGISENGELQINTNGTTSALGGDYSSTGSTGITFSTDISGSNLRLLYSSSALGVSGTFKYKIKKWNLN